jgi:DNA-directed RNA polymerase specialized sigma24 family protein
MGPNSQQFADLYDHPEVSAEPLVRLSEALDQLASSDRRLAEVVDLKYFCGYTFEDIAAMRGDSKRTVLRDWDKARLLLFRQLKDLPDFSADRVE